MIPRGFFFLLPVWLLLTVLGLAEPRAFVAAYLPPNPPLSRTIRAPTVVALGNSNNNDNQKLDKGFNLLELASSVVPQGRIVNTVKETWKFAWTRMMAELAPQDSKGRYTRPSYGFKGEIGSKQFPDEPGRYHLYVGNPCPVRIVLCIHMGGTTESSVNTLYSIGSTLICTFFLCIVISI